MESNAKRTKERKPRVALTARAVATLKPGEWASDVASRGEGVLQARRLASGQVAFYLRTTTKTGTRVRVPLGSGIDFNAAKRRATELSLRYQSGEHDLRAALNTERRERERQRKAAEVAEQVAKDAEAAKHTRTLGALLTAYADQLKRDGKPSAHEVHRELAHSVRDAWPKLWTTPLASVTTDDLFAVVALPVERGHKRQAQVLRAYLRAAFSAGIKARYNAAALSTLRALHVINNPAANLTTIEGANRARDRALTLAELRAYWHRIRTEQDCAVLRFHLLTGCQRIRQLARATTADVDHDRQTLRLLDPKGRRSEPRKHLVPLVPEAMDAMHDMQSGQAGPFLFTVTGGASGANYASVMNRLHLVANAMHGAHELTGNLFTLGDLRRTVETRLAEAGISREVRGRLQSHGLSGVQVRHYDRYDYIVEMRTALEVLQRLLNGTDAKIVPIKRKA